MSYDYNALLSKINKCRKDENLLDEAVETFDVLSQHCPMTPLLWMQYANDAANLIRDVEDVEGGDEDLSTVEEIQVQTLELGLNEFPGSAILHLHYLQILLLSQTIPMARIVQAFEQAIQVTGRGSHRNEDVIVAQIYNRYAVFAISQQDDKNKAKAIYKQRAAVPMKEANQSLLAEFQTFCRDHSIDVTSQDEQELEQGRRQAARWFTKVQSFEDEIDEAMQEEHVLSRYQMSLDAIEWRALIKKSDCSFWMGLGGVKTAAAFIKYAQMCSRFKSNNKDRQEAADHEEWIHSLSLLVYERGVAECPTVESVWLAYLKDLLWMVSNGSPQLTPVVKSVATRAFRNCPFSAAIVEQRIHSCFVMAKIGQDVLDPDELMKIVNEALAAKFLVQPLQQLQIYMAATIFVKRRILSLLVPNYDEPFEKGTDDQPSNLSDAAEEEIQDLAEDLREMYDTADEHLRKHQQKWSEGRLLLWSERSKTECYLLTPLVAAMDENSSASRKDSETVRCFDKLLKVHNPIHPDSTRAYCQMLLSRPLLSPADVANQFKRARETYRKGINALGRHAADPEAEACRRRLYQDYLDFEKSFGSERSYNFASKLVQKKIHHSNPVENANDRRPKRKLDGQYESESQEKLKKQAKREADTKPEAAILSTDMKQTPPPTSQTETMDVESVQTTESEEPSQKQKTKRLWPESAKSKLPKVKVGKLEYPAHPFTVRVFNLAPNTEDMDLVDTFRDKCGAIVHAKVMREKQRHGRGQSKGWGLIQFEERESVDKALALHDTLGLHEKLVRVDRSHMPAVGLVPPGMHRVNPKGQGRAPNKRTNNQYTTASSKPAPSPASTKETPPKSAPLPASTKAETDGGANAPSVSSSSSGVLAFQPRGVFRKANARKRKI